MDVLQDEDLLWVVQEAFHAPLPGSWTEHTDSEGRIYFFHEVSNESSWEHPMDAVYRELIGLVKRAREEAPAATEEHRALYIHGHLREVHQRALRGLEAWSGPYPSPEGEYYYNQAMKVSTWECPVNRWEQELAIRHNVLCRCLLGESLVVGPDGSVVGASAASSSRPGDCAIGRELLQGLQLPLGLVRRDMGGTDAPATPSTSRSFHTARSGANSSRSLKSSALASSSAHGGGAGGCLASPVSRGLSAGVPESSNGEEEDDDEDNAFDFSFSAAMDPARILRENAHHFGNADK